MGRREQRAELEATWTVYEPVTSGKPMTRADRDASLTPEEVHRIAGGMIASMPKHLRGLARRQRGA